MTTRLHTLAALLIAATAPLPAQEVLDSDHHRYRAVTVVDGLEHPWGMAFLPGGDLLVTERPGRLRLVSGGTLHPTPLGGVPAVGVGGQGGLLDVALHPDFAENRLVYLSYSKARRLRGRTTAVARGRLEGHALRDVEEIWEADAWTDRGVHFGSRLVFDGDGHLFVTVGDRGEMREAQDRGNHQGTVVRLRDDGRVPGDNPFVGEPGVLPEIWAWGVRSPQGLTLHPETGALWETEHGPRGGDELNVIERGANYGWPEVTHGIDYDGSTISTERSAPGMADPVYAWVPSIATSGLMIYSGRRFPRWRGSAFVGGLAGQHLARVELDGRRATGVERLLDGLGHRIRDVREGPDGLIWILVDAPRAPLLRLEPAGG